MQIATEADSIDNVRKWNIDNNVQHNKVLRVARHWLFSNLLVLLPQNYIETSVSGQLALQRAS